ncbi:hypothetical protein I203_102545 [Kwoniella mangroviensis CBS 8507]|uniref:uncharacterized protein n=1 Tax=Kwoniella mangroviensis CBS 8507 TaxID=1296122 RepID=UPI00080D4BE1|nr:uncharacterized protein I203_03530 [Kwoniella mangroviensis CBS 8507]OCF66849.1 hypothetical protein I203_03530 [Kwoniella mangroviensis CBS 8507]
MTTTRLLCSELFLFTPTSIISSCLILTDSKCKTNIPTRTINVVHSVGMHFTTINQSSIGTPTHLDATKRNSLIQVANSLSVLGLSQPEEESIVYKLASMSRGEIPAPEAGWWNRVTNVISGRGTSSPKMILTEEQLDTISRKAGLATQIRTVKGVLEAYRDIVIASRDSSSMV